MFPVQLFVYDLSRGLAKQLSLPIIGKAIEGIWHTSIVVNNREIYYGQGIFDVKPGTTCHGKPLRVHELGETEANDETITQFRDALAENYTADTYKLMEHNCNHFSNDLSLLLTGKEIPKYITDLPNEVLSSPGAGRLIPLIDTMFGNIARSIPDKTLATSSHASKNESQSLPTPISKASPQKTALSATNHSTRAMSTLATPEVEVPLPEEEVD